MIAEVTYLMKQAVFQVAHHGGINDLARWLNRRRLLVLCYHSVISDDAPHDPRTNIAVTRSQFELQLRELVKCFTPVTVDQMIAAYYNGQDLPHRAVLVTFDDGYRNNLTLAAPLLLQYGVPAVFFVATSHISAPHLLWTQEIVERVVAWPGPKLPWNASPSNWLPEDIFGRVETGRQIAEAWKRKPNQERVEFLDTIRSYDLEIDIEWKHELYDFMSWDEVRKIHQMGFEIGSHTVSHPILTGLSTAALQQEMENSKEKVAMELDTACRTIAYPNGGELDVSPAVCQAAGGAGYELGFTLIRSGDRENSNPLSLPRVCVTRDISFRRFQLLVAGI